MCVDYVCLQREANLSLLNKVFEDTSFNELTGIGIPERLLRIFSCYGYIQDEDSKN